MTKCFDRIRPTEPERRKRIEELKDGYREIDRNSDDLEELKAAILADPCRHERISKAIIDALMKENRELRSEVNYQKGLVEGLRNDKRMKP